jgi:hypothetical protein
MFSIKQIFSLNNIPADFFHEKTKVIYSDGQSVQMREIDKDEKSTLNVNEPFEVKTLSGIIFIRTKKQIQILFDEKEVRIIDVSEFGSMQLKLFTNDIILLRCLNKKEEWGMICFSLKGNILWTSNYSIPFLAKTINSNRGILYGFSTKIVCVSLDNGKVQWSIDVREIFQEEKLDVVDVNVTKGLLFIFCRTAYDAFTLCMDMYTGEVIRKINEVKSELKEFNGNLYCVKGFDKIGKLNQDDFTLEIFDYSQILRPIDMTIRSSNFYISGENYLFFVDGGAIPKNRFGVIDMNNGKLVHTETFARSLLIGNLDVRGNRIFVHTSDNELHVYEFLY